MKQEPFAVEQFMDKYESDITYNLGETCVESISINDLLQDVSPAEKENFVSKLLASKLTYGHIRGSPELRDKIAQLYGDSSITREHVIITNGAIGANFLAFYALVNPGDHVIVVDPTYQQLSSVPAMFGAIVDKLIVEPSTGYLPDLKWLESTISQNKTKMLVINNPNNPTGYVWDDSTLQAIIAICQRHCVTLYSDEVYRPLFHTGSPASSAVTLAEDGVIVSGSMSKAFSLAGLRLGWLVTRNKSALNAFYEKRDYNTISVSVLDDACALLALQNADKLLLRNHNICEKNLSMIKNFVKHNNDKVSWIEPRGGSTCFLRLNNYETTMELAQTLAVTSKVLVVPGEVFGYPGWIRVGFGNSTSDVEGGLAILSKHLQ
ncbi:putative capreomycidine synthase [Clavispora lusitaniae]|uniref:Capreomycidine synthase n=1 Tax=Clavispora lusitaniae TaxID=36911 RepID=A0ACD0WN49_CLALS|nr:putative capreomycidine synthase [Clavispora lusitaniae]QFZ34416.1 putative capreomycidine synthase [Clavispora lusitaniae]QFZ40100.1 putative capreomycidine synthase [Clavispora lusitaniae]QFZ45782.1 putative capreomycidine synthase [Clavispora lusitaniae]QFZ51446.1 putative capreomycidine synthase [Clavispora lusitaniae]